MLTTIKGVYENGKIVLTEEPPVKTKADVIVTFLNGVMAENNTSKRILGGLEGKIKTPDDFDLPLDELKDYMY
jgi:Protein of unknown function (DUF2281)